jgi:hypothetical protein
MQKLNKNAKNMAQEDKRQNEIIRIQKKQNNFVMLDKGFIEDERLSWKAKGILTYLLSKPDGWKVIVGDIVKHSPDGKGAIYSGLRELKKWGYYKKEPVRDEKGMIIRWESIVYECPNEENKNNTPQDKKSTKNNEKSPIITPLTNFQYMENQDIDNSFMENRERNNINISNNQFHQNDISIYPDDPNNEAPPNPPITDKIDTANNIIKTFTPDEVAQKISLDELKNKYEDKHEELNLLFDCVCEVLTVDNPHTPTFRISKQNIPFVTVKNTFMQLEKAHFEYVIDCLNKNDNKFKINKNTKSYLMTSLFHAPRTITYYFNRAFKQKPPVKDKFADFFEKAKNKTYATFHDDSHDFADSNDFDSIDSIFDDDSNMITT